MAAPGTRTMITAVASHQASRPAAVPAGNPQPQASTITPSEFFRADVRVGVILRAEEFPQARNPAYKLWIDFGELGTRVF